MKKRILALVIMLVMTFMALTSCGIIFGDVADSGDVTVVVENADGSYDVYKTYLESVENKSEGAKGVVEHLNKRDNHKLALTMVDSSYGAYVSAIGSIAENGADKMYVIVYTSVESDSYAGAPTVEYEGVTMYQAGVGLSGMSVEAGIIVLFRLEKSPY